MDNSQVGLTLIDSPPQSWSRDINNEFKRETDITKVGEDQRKVYEDQVKKIEDIKANFYSAKEKVQKYLEHQKVSEEGNKEKRSDQSSLTPEDRKALLSVFEGFYNLDQRKVPLSTQLQRASQENSELIASELSEGVKREVKRALNKINWNNGELKVMKDGKEQKDKDHFYGWGTWEKSPFKLFYIEENEWLNDMKGYEGSLVMQHRKVRQARARCRFASNGFGVKRNFATDVCEPNRTEYRATAQKSKDAIEMHIAEWLLKKMGQLPDSKLEKK